LFKYQIAHVYCIGNVEVICLLRKEMIKMNYISFFVPVSEIEQMNISGGSSKGKETYWKNVYDVLLNLFGMK
jgi:hypothetical protein